MGSAGKLEIQTSHDFRFRLAELNLRSCSLNRLCDGSAFAILLRHICLYDSKILILVAETS